MATEASPRAVSNSSAADAVMKMVFSHGGRFVSPGPDAAPRYVGGETRLLAVPRSASFRDLAARLSSEMAGGAEVRAFMHRLADDARGLEDVIVSVTCDAEVGHMRDEYDRLRAARPNARFRVFVVTNAGSPPASAARHLPRAVPSGLPPLPPTRMRRVQSDQALAASAQRFHRRPAYSMPPMRRVQSQPTFHHWGQQQRRFVCQRQDVFTHAPAPPPGRAVPHVCRRNVSGVPSVTAEAKPRSRDGNKSTTDGIESRRAIWEFE